MERVSVSLRESGESQSFVERQRQEIEDLAARKSKDSNDYNLE